MASRPDVKLVIRRHDGKIDVYTTGGFAHNGGLARVVRTNAATCACMTCNRTDCEHARAAAAHIRKYGAGMPAAPVNSPAGADA